MTLSRRDFIRSAQAVGLFYASVSIAGCARALQLPATGDPGRLVEGDGPTDDPTRPGLPATIPRPDGLQAARLRRFIRIWTKSTLAVGALAAGVGVARQRWWVGQS